MKKIFKIAVVGKGMLGTSAAKHLAELGDSVIILGPGEPKNKSNHKGVFGSHYDSGRITRVLDRNPYYAKISSASISRYRELEKLSGINFFQDVGQITVSGMHPYLDELKDCAIKNNLNHSILNDIGLKSTFPYLSFEEGMTGIFEKDTAGHIDPRKFIKAQCKAIVFFGGQIVEDTVVKIKDNKGSYTIFTKCNEQYNCDKVILATGSFANHLGIIPKRVSIQIVEHTVVLGEISDQTAKILFDMPAIIYHKTEEIQGAVYIMPPIKYPDGRFWIKIGQSRGHIMTHPEKNLVPWFQGDGNKEIAQWLESELSSILPKIKFLSIHSESCVTTKSKSGYQFIDNFKNSGIYSCLVGDGQSAKSADEIGRIAAHKILFGSVPDEYVDITFQNEYSKN